MQNMVIQNWVILQGRWLCYTKLHTVLLHIMYYDLFLAPISSIKACIWSCIVIPKNFHKIMKLCLWRCLKKIIIHTVGKPSRLVDWLRVPTPMRAIRVRVWVEVVGSVMEFISFQSSMKCQNFSGATLREKRKARCPRMNSLAKYLALQYIRRYTAELNEIECCSSQYSGKIGSHWPWSESRRVGSSPW